MPKAAAKPTPLSLRVLAHTHDLAGERPLDSPTLGVLSQGFGGTSLASPRLGAEPSSLMPPPPPRGTPKLTAAGTPVRLTRSNSSGLEVVVDGAPPLDRRASLSPGKRKSRDLPHEEELAGFVLEGPPGGKGQVEPAAGRPASPTKQRKTRKSHEDAKSAVPQTKVIDMFAPGMMRVPVFRIPALLPLPGGVTLCFCEARPDWHDAGVIDLVMRRSTDGGRTWGGARVVVDGGALGAGQKYTVGNPTAVYDASTQVTWLLLCSNHKGDNEATIHANCGRESRRVWVTSSADLGLTWRAPTEITAQVKRPGWTWYATGPGCGVQLEGGRLLIPANHAEDVAEPDRPYLVDRKRSRMVAHTIYSDDHGATWQLGGCAARHTNECSVAALADGRVVMNARDWSGRFTRVVQLSSDGGETWGPHRHDDELVEPTPQGCQGSMLAVKAKGEREGEGCGTLFFCNPSSDRREMLTVRRSDDGGASWSTKFVLEEGPSAYSAMGILASGDLGVLYERGDRISFATVPSHPRGPLGTF